MFERRNFKVFSSIQLIIFIFNVLFSGITYSQTPQTVLNLPLPGKTIGLTSLYKPLSIKGVKVFPEEPLRFDFIVDTGDSLVEGKKLELEAKQLVSYFLAALTIAEKDMWVNLSPYEKEKMIPDSFGDTQLGRDLLAQDYLLKQLTASLMDPKTDFGQKLWQRIYSQLYMQYGTTKIPIDTFNKVWIVPDKAVVYERGDSAFVAKAHLKVMLESDYFALKQNSQSVKTPRVKSQIDIRGLVREIILPELENEVNQGKTFSKLRQIVKAMVLATWYKEKMQKSFLAQTYVNKNKTLGVDTEDKQVNEKIYQQYLKALKKGVINYIAKEYDPYLGKEQQRRYFSGGFMRLGFSGGTGNSVVVKTDANTAAQALQPTSKHSHFYSFSFVLKSLLPKADNDSVFSERPFAKIKSFIENKNLSERFIAFNQKILQGNIPLKELLNNPQSAQDIFDFHFDHFTNTGTGHPVVMYRIDEELFPVRITDNKEYRDGIMPIITAKVNSQQTLQVLSLDDFLNLWSKALKMDRGQYRTKSFTQKYLRAMFKKEPLSVHNREVIIEEYLGQGLEGTVFKVCDVKTKEEFALKVSYDNLENEFKYWRKNIEIIRQACPEVMRNIVEFYSFYDHGELGTSILMDCLDRPISFYEYLAGLSPEERLNRGLKVLLEVKRTIEKLHRLNIAFGDLTSANIFLVYENGEYVVKILDPFREAATNIKQYMREDIFHFFHNLYWLVTGVIWPGDTWNFSRQVITGSYNPENGRKIFSHNPMSNSDSYKRIYDIVIEALWGSWDKYESAFKEIESVPVESKKFASFPFVATLGRFVGKLLSPDAIQKEVRAALNLVGSGVFLPIFSLPSYFGEKNGQFEYGMGDVGKTAYQFVDYLAQAKQKYWQILPISPTDEEYCENCVYRTDSVFALDFKIIPPDKMMEDGWITQDELLSVLPTFANLGRLSLVKDEFTYKRKLFSFAYEKYKKNKLWEKEFQSFMQEEAEWLEDYALYKAIERVYPTRWTNWEVGLRDKELKTIEAFMNNHQDEIMLEKFSQFLIHHYLQALVDYADSKGIVIIADLPIYSMHGSCDVWANRDVLILDDNGQRSVVGGAPPDIFGKAQAWNHPMYRWDKEETVNFWIRKYGRMFRLFKNGIIRADNIIGIITPWAYTFGQDPEKGWRVEEKYVGRALLDALFKAYPDFNRRVIGEDLGIVTDEVKEVMREYGLMGTRVLQFMPFNQGLGAVQQDMYYPENFGPRNFVYLGTHDTDVVREWWLKELSDQGRENFKRFMADAGIVGDISQENIAEKFRKYAMLQGGRIVIHQAQDLVVNPDGSTGLKASRMNKSGSRGHENWTWRLLPDAFNQVTQNSLLELTRFSDRTPIKAIERFPTITFGSPEVELAFSVLDIGDEKQQILDLKLRELIHKGLVREAEFTQGLLSVVYKHQDGKLYLLLSNHQSNTQYLSVEEKAVSLIRAVGQYVKQENPDYKSSFLENTKDFHLVKLAQEVSARKEKELQEVAQKSNLSLCEEMIAFMQVLLDPEASLDGLAQNCKIYLAANDLSKMIARPYRLAMREKLGPIWSKIWLKYESRVLSREQLVKGIISATLPEAQQLQELRWRALDAFSDQIKKLGDVRNEQSRVIQVWADNLNSPLNIENFLFADKGLPSFDTYFNKHWKGVSGVLEGKKQAVRVGRDIKGYLERNDFINYLKYLMTQVSSLRNEDLENQFVRIRNISDLRVRDQEQDIFLAMLERACLKRLALLKKDKTQELVRFPAKADMHTHSYCSDCGNQPIALLVYTAYLRGLDTLVLTDHQAIEGVLKAIEIGELFGLNVIPAVEVYTGAKVAGQEAIGCRRDVLVIFPDKERFKTWNSQGCDEETQRIFSQGWDRRLDGKYWGNVNIRRVTDWAKSRGGIPIVAHVNKFYTEDFAKSLNWDYTLFETMVQETGVCGFEISHPNVPFNDTVRLLRLINQYNEKYPDKKLVFTTGTDSHVEDSIGRKNLTPDVLRVIAGQDSDYKVGDKVRDMILEGLENVQKQHTQTRTFASGGVWNKGGFAYERSQLDFRVIKDVPDFLESNLSLNLTSANQVLGYRPNLVKFEMIPNLNYFVDVDKEEKQDSLTRLYARK